MRTQSDLPLDGMLSIVIPCWEERERLPGILDSIAKHCASELHRLEVLVADDGSRDGTAEVARREGERLGLTLRVLSDPRNRGKGHAVRRGMLAAEGDTVLLTDADESVPIASLERFLVALRDGPDLVIGTRRNAGATIEIRQAPLRERLGVVFRDLASKVVPGVSDFTCGFKLFRGDAARRIFRLQRLWGWGYDVEILLIARRLGLAVAEEPVDWRDDARTRVRLTRDGIRSAWDLVRILWNDRLGRYRGEL